MTTPHDDPFDTKQVRKEADEDRAAAEARVAAQEEARKRMARQRLEDERRRLTRERDDKKRKLDELRREIEEEKRKQASVQANIRTERSAETTREPKAPDTRGRHLLEAQLSRVKTSLASLAAPRHEETVTPDASHTQDLSRNLNTAKAAMEKATLEHAHLTGEIRQLKRTLEQKEAQERAVKKEKEEAGANVERLEKEKEGAALDYEMKNRAHRVAHEAKQKTAREKEALEKEQREIEEKLNALEEKEKESLREKQVHAEAARKAETEKMRTENVLHDLEHRVDQLTRELALIEGNLKDVENKLAQL